MILCPLLWIDQSNPLKYFQEQRIIVKKFLMPFLEQLSIVDSQLSHEPKHLTLWQVKSECLHMKSVTWNITKTFRHTVVDNGDAHVCFTFLASEWCKYLYKTVKQTFVAISTAKQMRLWPFSFRFPYFCSLFLQKKGFWICVSTSQNCKT